MHDTSAVLVQRTVWRSGERATVAVASGHCGERGGRRAAGGRDAKIGPAVPLLLVFLLILESLVTGGI
jgi:hypothetical protein